MVASVESTEADFALKQASHFRDRAGFIHCPRPPCEKASEVFATLQTEHTRVAMVRARAAAYASSTPASRRSSPQLVIPPVIK